MTRIVIDIDDEVLAEAAEEPGTTTTEDTVNAALREVVAHRRRLRAGREARESGR